MKYPEQVGSIKRKNKVMGVDAKLVLPTEEEYNSNRAFPLEMHSGYSRFVVTILDTISKTSPHANIPASELMFLKQKTDVALHKILEAKLSGISGSSEGETDIQQEIAYTQKLKGRIFNNMSPADVLLKDPGQKNALLRQKEWLTENLTKYAVNAQQIKAINEAIKLFEEGKLNRSESKPEGKSFYIYASDYKFMTAENEKGYKLIYFINIFCNPIMDYPFNINISNCYAPVISKEGGAKNIQMMSAVDKINSSLNVTEMEWCSLLNRMVSTIENFEQMNFARQYQLAKKHAWKPKTEESIS